MDPRHNYSGRVGRNLKTNFQPHIVFRQEESMSEDWHTVQPHLSRRHLTGYLDYPDP